MSDQGLLACIADTGRQLSAVGAIELASALESAGSPEKLMIKADSLPTPPQQKFARRLASEWRLAGSVGSDALSVALRASQLSAQLERAAETIELVWTGPKSERVPVAMNAEALNELVDGARRELLLVSYATYQMPQLVGKVSEAVERGVTVNLVLEFHGDHAEEKQVWDPVKGLGADLAEGVRIYQWPIDLREATPSGKVGYLHVKCAVADRRQAFVSSANLTVHAMERNMELGVVIRGGHLPDQMAEHFDNLISDGILELLKA